MTNKPSSQPKLLSMKDAVLAIQWDGTGYTWWILNKAEMPFTSNTLAGKTFLLGKGEDAQEVKPGDWILKNKAGNWHKLQELPTSTPTVDQWSRESALAAAKEAYKSFAGLPSEFDQWFDETYPTSTVEPADNISIIFADWLAKNCHYHQCDNCYTLKGETRALTTEAAFLIFKNQQFKDYGK